MSTIRNLTGIYDPTAVAEASRRAIVRHLPSAAVQGLGATDGETLAALVVGAVAVVLVVRGAMGYYVGKQFGRPWAGAGAGAVLGAPGLGVVALFGKGGSK
jgi:hypothetical protein